MRKKLNNELDENRLVIIIPDVYICLSAYEMVSLNVRIPLVVFSSVTLAATIFQIICSLEFISFVTTTSYPVSTPLGDSGGSQETWKVSSFNTRTSRLSTAPGTVIKKKYNNIHRSIHFTRPPLDWKWLCKLFIQAPLFL